MFTFQVSINHRFVRKCEKYRFVIVFTLYFEDNRDCTDAIDTLDLFSDTKDDTKVKQLIEMKIIK